MANRDDPSLDRGLPPSVLQLLAHPVRWVILRELALSDRTVRELTELVDEPQNLVSYHLRQLRDGGLVRARRSSADRRDSYYAIDLDACFAQLRKAGEALHPGLLLEPAATLRKRSRRRRPRVLFLCTGNSARSQIAEALLTNASEGTIESSSAGLRPKPLHPNAVQVLRRRGIDISGHGTTHVDDARGGPLDLVVTVCDRVRQHRPTFRTNPALAHWSMPDPSAEAASDSASYPAFERTADELASRISYLLPQLTSTS